MLALPIEEGGVLEQIEYEIHGQSPHETLQSPCLSPAGIEVAAMPPLPRIISIRCFETIEKYR